MRTVEDFGYQGEPPSRIPSCSTSWRFRLVEQGWSMKAMHRADRHQRDLPPVFAGVAGGAGEGPGEPAAGRGPRVRLEAEVIRDSVLQVSGMLFERIGGPSVFPPQPPGVSSEGAYGGLAWNVSPGGDRYRRGLYTFTKRTAPFAMTLTFDGPSGEVCVARREMSNSPLQALTLLNDPVFVEGSQALGRVDGEDGRDPSRTRIGRLFRLCLSRAPQPDELSMLVHFFQNQTTAAGAQTT